MRSPLPRNKIVGLALLGVVLTAGVSAALAIPGAFSLDDDEELPDGAPEPTQDFQPSTRYDDDDRYEHEEHDDDDDDDDD